MDALVMSLYRSNGLEMKGSEVQRDCEERSLEGDLIKTVEINCKQGGH